jgi:hypothetical protein
MSLFSKTPRPVGGPTQPLIQWVPGFFAGWIKGQKPRMSGAIPLLLLYVCMGLRGKTSLFKFIDWLKAVRSFDCSATGIGD